MAQRDAERIKREKQLEATLADYYQAHGEVERIRGTPKSRRRRSKPLFAKPYVAWTVWARPGLASSG